MTHVLDAHALIWSVANSPRLGSAAATIFSDPDARLLLPATALAEACWAVDPGKSTVQSADVLLDAVQADPRMQVIALDADIIRICHEGRLHVIREMHDRQIVATTLRLIESGEPAALVTRDANIARSGLVPVVW
jgi:PIN domain nuclease of toxin-antitoxin system